MSLFTRLSAAAKTFTTPVDESVVKVIRTSTTVEVRPGMSAFNSALSADLVNEDQFHTASFTITNPDGSTEVVSAEYICKGGQKLTVTINRDSKG